MAVLPQLVVSCVVLTMAGNLGVKSESTCDIDIENTLRTLLSPEQNSMQVQALRRDVLRKFQEILDRVEEEEEDERNLKRSLSSLAAWNNLPEHKRNVEALARAGYLKTLPDEEDGDANYKRSIANLAKNGQLPMPSEGHKRGIESLARNGDLHPKKDIQDQIGELYGKRNSGSMGGGYSLPMYSNWFLSSWPRIRDSSWATGGKFNGNLGKRDIPSLREDEYSSSLHKLQAAAGPGEKRNLQAIKAQYKPRKFKRSTDQTQKRSRREADYFDEENTEYPSPVYQYPSVYDYDDWMQDLTGAYPNAEKRFLGSVARSGWFRPSSSRYSRFVQPEKRHIGSLARLGWLPSFRNVRRFNRSGRSTSANDICRETTSDGEAEDDTNAQGPALSLEDKRYLLQPAVDNILLRKVFMHPRSH